MLASFCAGWSYGNLAEREGFYMARSPQSSVNSTLSYNSLCLGRLQEILFLVKSFYGFPYHLCVR